MESSNYIAAIGKFIWGIGSDEKEALRDGKDWVRDYNSRCECLGEDREKISSLEVFPATYELYEYVDNEGGGHVDWYIDDQGIAVLRSTKYIKHES